MSSKALKMRATSHSFSPVTDNDDLLSEILLRLPVRSRVRFKSVSKQWLSVISDLELVPRRSSSPSSLYLKHCGLGSRYWEWEFTRVNITAKDHSVPRFRAATFAPFSHIRIVQSCNGLLLCSTYVLIKEKKHVVNYVYNPTTNRLFVIPGGPDRIHQVALAFDPFESPRYKVIGVKDSKIFVFSPDSGLWRPTRAKLPAGAFEPVNFYHHLVYCNGAIHWFCSYRTSTPYFHFATEEIGHVPMAELTPRIQTLMDLRYFGASRGCVHAVNCIRDTGDTHFSVFELEKDYSKWAVKYRVDIVSICRAFPQVISRRVNDGLGNKEFDLSVISVVRCEVEEDSFLVMNVPGKIVGYNVTSKSLYELADVENSFNFFWGMGTLVIEPHSVYPYIESIARVQI